MNDINAFVQAAIDIPDTLQVIAYGFSAEAFIVFQMRQEGINLIFTQLIRQFTAVQAQLFNGMQVAVYGTVREVLNFHAYMHDV